jgi:hypothetical protein
MKAETLLKAGVSVDCRDQSKWTPLHWPIKT